MVRRGVGVGRCGWIQAGCVGILLGWVASGLARSRESWPEGFTTIALAGEFEIPVGLTFTPQGRLLVIEKGGRVLVHDGLNLQPEPFLDLRDEVNDNGDRGLLGIALHPGFQPDSQDRAWVYLLYTVSPVPGQDWDYDRDGRYSFSRLARYRATETPEGWLQAVAGSRELLLGHQSQDGSVPDGISSCHLTHSTGALRFARDGSLLLGTGDGASAFYFDAGGHDPECFDDVVHPQTGLRGPIPKVQDSGSFRAQDLRSLSGKILRLDPETGHGYPDNPFYNGDLTSNPSKVWALGLRNPYRMSLEPSADEDHDRDGPEALLAGDVGADDWEEMDRIHGGENFGWPCFEGPLPLARFQEYQRGPDPLGRPDCTKPLEGTLRGPMLAYNHDDPNSLSPAGLHQDEEGWPQAGFIGGTIVGGIRYTGDHYPARYHRRLFFADYLFGWIRTLETDEDGQLTAIRDFGTDGGRAVDFAQHPTTGDLYFVAIDLGQILHLRYRSPDESVPSGPVGAGYAILLCPLLALALQAYRSAHPTRERISA